LATERNFEQVFNLPLLRPTYLNSVFCLPWLPGMNMPTGHFLSALSSNPSARHLLVRPNPGQLKNLSCGTSVAKYLFKLYEIRCNNQCTTCTHSWELTMPSRGHTVAHIHKFPHYAFYPTFHTTFPLFPFGILPSAFHVLQLHILPTAKFAGYFV